MKYRKLFYAILAVAMMKNISMAAFADEMVSQAETEVLEYVTAAGAEMNDAYVNEADRGAAADLHEDETWVSSYMAQTDEDAFETTEKETAETKVEPAADENLAVVKETEPKETTAGTAADRAGSDADDVSSSDVQKEEKLSDEKEEKSDFSYGEPTQFFEENPKITAAIERLKAFREEFGENQAIFTKGSYLFFEKMGADEAIAYLDDKYAAPYMYIGTEDDATSITNMLYSMNYLYQCNKLRKSRGLSELFVSDTEMGAAQVSCNMAAMLYQHPHIANSNGEILAWNYKDPYEAWYYKEKELYDQGERSFYKVGHYLLIIDPNFKSTGFALTYNKKPGGYANTTCEEFSYERIGYNVDAYTDRLINWMDWYIADTKKNQAQEENIRSFVTRLYEVCLGREPDANGFESWTKKLKSGQVTGAQAAGGFIFSNESVNKNRCNDCFIDQLYKCFMDRAADASGKKFWTEKISSGYSRADVFGGFVGSKEFKKTCERYGITVGAAEWKGNIGVLDGDCRICGTKNKTVVEFVDRLYSVCLGRKADAAGRDYWVKKLKAGETGERIANGFIFSKEQKAKNLTDDQFIECLYQAFFGRKADSAKSYWLGKLKSSSTREDVVKGFANSVEFQKLCNQYGMKAH